MARYYKGNGLCGPTTYICTTKRDTPGPKYSLPTLTGYDGHGTDGTKNRAPAYSLRTRLKTGEKINSPGPAAYLPIARQTRVGNDGTPAFSLAARHKDLTKHISPGPGAYSPEKHYYPPSRTSPEYSMAKRLKSRVNDKLFNPAPNTYTLPSGIGTAHPDLKRAPAFFMTFRDKRGGFHYDMSKTPGPAAYGASSQNIIKLAAPEYTMRPRCRLPSDKTKNPGPAAHRHEDSPHTAYSTKKGAPSFSFGRRHHEYAVAPVFTDCEIIRVPQVCAN